MPECGIGEYKQGMTLREGTNLSFAFVILLAGHTQASWYLSFHFLTNVTEPQLALSFSFRGCLWSSGV